MCLWPSGLITGRRSLRAKNRQTINLAQKWVKNGFFVPGWEVAGSKVAFGADFVKEKRPESHFGPTFGPLPARDEKPILDPLLCQINGLAILALRDLRPVITQGKNAHVRCMRPEMTTQILRKQFFCVTDVCNGKLIPITHNVCNGRPPQKVPCAHAQLHKRIPARTPCVTDGLCNWKLIPKS